MTIDKLEYGMKRLTDMKEKRRYPRYSIELPLEYWETDNSRYGGLVGNVSEIGLLLYCIYDMPVGEKLRITVFFSTEYRFDGFAVAAKIVRKRRHDNADWSGYQYGLEFIPRSEKDRRKIIALLGSHLESGNFEA